MLRHPRIWLFLLAVWWGALFYLSHQSKLIPPGPDLANMDKVYHAIYFMIGGLCFFVWLRFRCPGLRWMAVAAITVGFCSLTGAVDEVHQWFIPNRSGLDPGDWLADTTGGVLGVLLGNVVVSKIRRNEEMRAGKAEWGS
jgi:VanZ family protein